MDRFAAGGNGERGAQYDAANLIMVSSAGVEVAKISGGHSRLGRSSFEGSE